MTDQLRTEWSVATVLGVASCVVGWPESVDGKIVHTLGTFGVETNGWCPLQGQPHLVKATRHVTSIPVVVGISGDTCDGQGQDGDGGSDHYFVSLLLQYKVSKLHEVEERVK